MIQSFPQMVDHSAFKAPESVKPVASPTLVTVTIGRNVPEDHTFAMFSNGDEFRPMTRKAWQEFQTRIKTLLRCLPGGDQGMAEVFGPFEGVGEWDGVEEDSVTFTALTTHPDFDSAVKAFDDLLGAHAADYGQDAIAWSYGPAFLARRP